MFSLGKTFFPPFSWVGVVGRVAAEEEDGKLKI